MVWGDLDHLINRAWTRYMNLSLIKCKFIHLEIKTVGCICMILSYSGQKNYCKTYIKGKSLFVAHASVMFISIFFLSRITFFYTVIKFLSSFIQFFLYVLSCFQESCYLYSQKSAVNAALVFTTFSGKHNIWYSQQTMKNWAVTPTIANSDV